MEENDTYKIEGIWYSKPRVAYQPDGSIVYGREGLYIWVGLSMTIKNTMKKVNKIHWSGKENQFYIHLEGDRIITIPRNEETEVYYAKETKTK